MPGTRVVNVLNWIVSCRTCRKRNRADRCTHVVRRPQHFQKFSDKERLQALMSVFAGSYEREMLNTPDEPTRKPVFDGNAIDWLTQSPEAVYRSNDYMPSFIVSVDPNGGSLSSDMVVTSCAYKMINGSVCTIVRVSFPRARTHTHKGGLDIEHTSIPIFLSNETRYNQRGHASAASWATSASVSSRSRKARVRRTHSATKGRTSAMSGAHSRNKCPGGAMTSRRHRTS